MIKLFSTVCAMILSIAVFAQTPTPIEGRWDLVVEKDGQQLPSWLEVRHSGNHTLVGRFCYAFGSARPISEVKFKDGAFSFAIPPQWEPGDTNMEFNGTMSGETLKGTMVYTDGKTYNWTGTKAPLLKRDKDPQWNKPVMLFNGKDLSGWHAQARKISGLLKMEF